MTPLEDALQAPVRRWFDEWRAEQPAPEAHAGIVTLSLVNRFDRFEVLPTGRIA